MYLPVPIIFSLAKPAVLTFSTNSTTWLYGSEVLPIALRSKVMGLAAASHFIVNVAITEAGPSAFANIHENYYYVFVACSLFFLIMAYLYFPETRRKSLEQIAEDFGDKVVLVDAQDVDQEAVAEAKMEESSVEQTENIGGLGRK